MISKETRSIRKFVIRIIEILDYIAVKTLILGAIGGGFFIFYNIFAMSRWPL